MRWQLMTKDVGKACVLRDDRSVPPCCNAHDDLRVRVGVEHQLDNDPLYQPSSSRVCSVGILVRPACDCSSSVTVFGIRAIVTPFPRVL